MAWEDDRAKLNYLAKVIVSSEIKQVKAINGSTYYYVVNPITSGVGIINPDVLNICSEFLSKMLDSRNVNYIVTFETMGIHLASILSVKANLPLVIARKFNERRGMPCDNAIVFTRKTKYEEASFIICGLSKGDKVVLVDSIISTGNTMITAVKALRKAGIIVKGILGLIERLEYNARERIISETGIIPKSLLKIRVKEGKVKITN